MNLEKRSLSRKLLSRTPEKETYYQSLFCHACPTTPADISDSSGGGRYAKNATARIEDDAFTNGVFGSAAAEAEDEEEKNRWKNATAEEVIAGSLLQYTAIPGFHMYAVCVYH